LVATGFIGVFVVLEVGVLALVVPLVFDDDVVVVVVVLVDVLVEVPLADVLLELFVCVFVTVLPFVDTVVVLDLLDDFVGVDFDLIPVDWCVVGLVPVVV
jgi:hypothetical protein